MCKKSCAEDGFTLIEMVIVILIGGILLAFLGASLLAYTKKNRSATTEYRIERIQEALEQYLSVNRRYPCAAARNQDPSHVSFGREAVSNCSADAAAGTVRVGQVRIGSVPARSLNIPDDYMVDGWGRRFTYAVTERLATNLTYTADGGLISVIDANSNSLVVPNNSAHYVVVSHGVSGEGAFNLSGSRYLNCSTTARDRENCDDSNVIFMSTLVNSDAVIANFFDDYMAYQGTAASNLGIPAGAIVAFDGACPSPGWSEYTLARGRFVIGATTTNGSEEIYDLTSLPSTSNHTKTFTVGTASGQHDTTFFPPYLALRYCEKLP